MVYDFNNKTFKVILNEGPGAEVNHETVFHFKQTGDVVHADYSGGGVKMGKFLGRLNNNEVEFKYVQINVAGEFHLGHSRDRIEVSDNGRLRLIDEWEWDTKEGKGCSILEEI